MGISKLNENSIMEIIEIIIRFIIVFLLYPSPSHVNIFLGNRNTVR